MSLEIIDKLQAELSELNDTMAKHDRQIEDLGDRIIVHDNAAKIANVTDWVTNKFEELSASVDTERVVNGFRIPEQAQLALTG